MTKEGIAINRNDSIGDSFITTAIALVDYDNVKTLPDRSKSNVVENLSEMIPKLVAEARAYNSEVSELIVRFYGGWLDECGRYSRNAEWMLTSLAWYRGRYSGVIVKPSLAISIAVFSKSPIVGTLRGWPKDPKQKMVDSMIAMDTIEFSKQSLSPVLLTSDDDDLVPAALSAADKAKCLVLLRMRREGWGLNDHLLRQRGVLFKVIQGGTNG